MFREPNNVTWRVSTNVSTRTAAAFWDIKSSGWTTFHWSGLYAVQVPPAFLSFLLSVCNCRMYACTVIAYVSRNGNQSSCLPILHKQGKIYFHVPVRALELGLAREVRPPRPALYCRCRRCTQPSLLIATVPLLSSCLNVLRARAYAIITLL